MDDAQIARLNQQYLSRNYPTDVLSFPMAGGPSPGINSFLLGDVVISVETAQRSARKKNCSLHAELARLLIHGILHLMGYDHEHAQSDRLKMRRLEKKLFNKLCDEGIVSAQ